MAVLLDSLVGVLIYFIILGIHICTVKCFQSALSKNSKNLKNIPLRKRIDGVWRLNKEQKLQKEEDYEKPEKYEKSLETI